MAYTNGYELTAVLVALKDRVGFRQPVGTGAPTLSSAVTTSASGRYFQDFHAMVTVENIKQTMELPAATDGQLITYLGEIRQAAIMRVLGGVFSQPQVIDRPALLFHRTGVNDTAENNAGKFIGYEIIVADIADAGVQIDALHVLLDGAATFNVYLFKDGDPAAVFTQSVTTVANTIKEVVLTDKVIGRGKYYLGYFQNDLGSVKAIRQQVAHWNSGRMYSARPMQSDATGATTFNRDEISYGEPIGLNVEMSSFRDHTTQIKRKAAMFDEVIGLQMAYSVIEQVIYSVRRNANESILKDQLDRVGIQLDLSGVAPISESPKVTGLKQRIDREILSIQKSFYPTAKASVVSLC